MQVIARFDAPGGEIAVKEDRRSGARHYLEGGVVQSCVLPGGEAGVAYIRLMAALLAEGSDALLLGCGGGSLATMLHRRARSITVVEINPVSFQLARTFFWMPGGITCITADMREFARTQRRSFDAIGIDVGGPSFSYENVLDAPTIVRLRRALRPGGRIAVNISLVSPDDPVPGRIAHRLKAAGLDTWAFLESPHSAELNAVILASARRESPAALAAMGGETWSLARLSG